MPPPYSKSQVDRAGQVFAGRITDDHPTLEQIEEAEAVIDWWRSEHAKPLSQVAANLRYYAQREGIPIVSQRLKRVPTIANKLRREPRMKLSRMADVGGVRAVVPDQVAAYRIASNLRRNWTITKMRDYVAAPKADGYRALHLVNRHRGRMIEIQLRTQNQDRWANRVELLSRFAFPGLKYGEGSPGVRQYMYDWAKILARHDSGQIESEEIDDLLTAQVINLLKEANES